VLCVHSFLRPIPSRNLFVGDDLTETPTEMETRDDMVVVREVIGTTEERAVPREHRRSGWSMRGLHLALG